MTESTMNALHDATRDMLLRERDVVMGRMAGVERDARDLELDTDGVPSTGYAREQALSVMLSKRLFEIDSALANLDLGIYGVCTDCRQQIPPKRLQALPFATLCVGCQSVADKRMARRA